MDKDVICISLETDNEEEFTISKLCAIFGSILKLIIFERIHVD